MWSYRETRGCDSARRRGKLQTPKSGGISEEVQTREGPNWEDPAQWRFEGASGRRRRPVAGVHLERKQQLWLGRAGWDQLTSGPGH